MKFSVNFLLIFQIVCFLYHGDGLAAVARKNGSSTELYKKNVLNQIAVNDHGDISIDFKNEVLESSITSEVLNGFVQLSIQNGEIFPAKIVHVQDQLIYKIFAYQYSKNVIRCRFFIKDTNGGYNKKFKFIVKGKKILVNHTLLKDIKTIQEVDLNAALLEKENTIPISYHMESNSTVNSHQILTSSEEIPSVWMAFPKLFIVVFFLVFFTFIIKSLKGSKKNSSVKTKRALSKLAGFAKIIQKKQDPFIEVISTHHLDNKKSIAVMKVVGKILILGVANESINLIAQIQNGVLLERDALDHSIEDDFLQDVATDSSTFLAALKNEKEKNPSIPSNEPYLGVRSRIKSRLEGLKKL